TPEICTRSLRDALPIYSLDDRDQRDVRDSVADLIESMRDGHVEATAMQEGDRTDTRISRAMTYPSCFRRESITGQGSGRQSIMRSEEHSSERQSRENLV